MMERVPPRDSGRWELLGQLVEQCIPYEIVLGTDLDAAAELAIRTLKEGRA